MEAAPPPGGLGRRGLDQPGHAMFRQYYTDNDFVLSPEGILKALSAVVCVVSGVLYLSGAASSSAPSVQLSAGAVALGCSAVSALLYAAVVLHLPLYAPQAALFTDVIISTVMGALLLILAVLTMTACELNGFACYVPGPLGIVNAGMVTGSAVMTYVAVMQQWDAQRAPREPPRSPSTEQDV